MAARDQRIGTRYTVGGMNQEDTGAYRKGSLSFTGRSDSFFSADAISVIRQASHD